MPGGFFKSDEFLGRWCFRGRKQSPNARVCFFQCFVFSKEIHSLQLTFRTNSKMVAVWRPIPASFEAKEAKRNDFSGAFFICWYSPKFQCLNFALRETPPKFNSSPGKKSAGFFRIFQKWMTNTMEIMNGIWIWMFCVSSKVPRIFRAFLIFWGYFPKKSLKSM